MAGLESLQGRQEAIVKGAASCVVEKTTGLKGSWRDAEAWQNLVRSGSEQTLLKGQTPLWLKLQDIGDAKTTNDHQRQQKYGVKLT